MAEAINPLSFRRVGLEDSKVPNAIPERICYFWLATQTGHVEIFAWLTSQLSYLSSSVYCVLFHMFKFNLSTITNYINTNLDFYEQDGDESWKQKEDAK